MLIVRIGFTSDRGPSIQAIGRGTCCLATVGATSFPRLQMGALPCPVLYVWPRFDASICVFHSTRNRLSIVNLPETRSKARATFIVSRMRQQLLDNVSMRHFEGAPCIIRQANAAKGFLSDDIIIRQTTASNRRQIPCKTVSLYRQRGI